MSTIGASTMTKISETVNEGPRPTGSIIWEGPVSAAAPSVPSTLSGIPRSQTQTTIRGGKKTVQASYSEQDSLEVSSSRTVSRSSDGSANEEPIEMHPGYRPAGSSPSDPQPGWPANWQEGEPVINDNYKGGVQSYLRPGIVYRRTQYISGFTFSESNLTSGVGELSAPTGMNSPTSNKWQKTGIDVQENLDGSAVVTTSWLFNPDGWDTDIYS